MGGGGSVEASGGGAGAYKQIERAEPAIALAVMMRSKVPRKAGTVAACRD